MSDSLLRVISGFMAATCVAIAARRAGSLSTSGAAAAAVIGSAVVAAGWSWGALLLFYFAAASGLSRAGASEKSRRIESIVAKGGARDATQVMANGGVFALLALASLGATSVHLRAVVSLAAVGALAAAAADTWATEIGTLVGGTPRAVHTGRPVPTGTSGAVSASGTVAMVAGALVTAIAAHLLGVVHGIAAVTLAGCVGALADTLVGATLQERRWCDHCACATERRRHDCGRETRHIGGVGVVDNDAVNFVATVVGAAAAPLLAFVR